MASPLSPMDRKTSSASGRRRGLPLFLRIFVVVLGAVLCAQAVNFAIILLVRLPQPRAYSLNEIADVLRTGQSAATGLLVSSGTPPAESGQDQRDLRVRLALAVQLGVSEAQLRVNVSRPPSLLPAKTADEAKPLREARSPKPGHGETDSRSEVIIGGFRAALRQGEGEWRIVRPDIGLMESWQWQSLLWLLGTLAIATPLAWMVSRRVAEPVNLFSAAAERLGRDPSTPPLAEIAGPPEIAAAVTAFNEMQGRLKRYIDDRTTMVAAIAHDLRTPLMRLTLLLEQAPGPVRDAAEAEIREMTDRIRGALAFVRDLAHPSRRQRLELRSLLESIVDDMMDRGADVAIEPGDDATIDADIAGIRSLFANLVENAIQYGDRARLTLRRADGQAVVEIADSGPGIPAWEFEAVFTPFYRLEASRNRATGGSGLGLASASAVARGHGGEVTLANRDGGGLVARVLLPRPHI